MSLIGSSGTTKAPSSRSTVRLKVWKLAEPTTISPPWGPPWAAAAGEKGRLTRTFGLRQCVSTVYRTVDLSESRTLTWPSR